MIESIIGSISVDEITDPLHGQFMKSDKVERRGRPARSGEAADVRVMLRLTATEFAALEKAANAYRLPISAFVRDAALRAARRHA